MKKFTAKFLGALMFLFAIFTTKAYSQAGSFDKEKALQLVSENAAAIGLWPAGLNNVKVSDAYYDKTAAAHLVYIQQTYKNVPVYNAIKSIAFKNGKLMSAAGSFATKINSNATSATGIAEITAASAVSAAASHVDHPINANITALSTGQRIVFPSYNASQENITAELLWVPADDGNIYLCWQVKFVPVNTSDYWLINVDAKSGKVISKDNLTVYEKKIGNEAGFNSQNFNSDNKFNIESTTGTASVSGTYRVIPYPAESSIHPGGTPVLVTDPFNNAGAGNLVARYGWHSDGTTDYNITRGNNVWAREDRAATNGNPTPGRSATSTTSLPSLTFDFMLDEGQQPTTTTNQNFALTQLFYWNNIMHDITYQYGFNEVSGNFQNFNGDGGGIGGDYVFADAQDGSGTNNANFATPQDGYNPRMQMYLFSGSATRTAKVSAPASIAGFKQAVEGAVSTANKLATVGGRTGQAVLYGTAGANSGCTALSGTPLTGKIALVDVTGGTCSYSVRIKNAQNAGAIAVVVIKSSTGAPFAMTGSDNTITIPAVMITQADGMAIKNAIAAGSSVTMSLNPLVNIDGDLDNGVMAHEYTHGISNRLTGGPAIATCLTNKEQMGEGWSDYNALMLTTNWQAAQVTDGPLARPIGTYAFGENITDGGIRIYPYSTNMITNPWTYAMLATNTSGETHNVGEIWATVLWDMTWNIIQMNGINPDMYNASSTGGNSIAMMLVHEGMKLQSCRPGFLDGRDGILKADTLLYNGQYSCAIWRAFARRGMGVKAKQGSSNIYTDQTADFTLPDAIVKKMTDKAVADQNQDITYTLKASCKCVPISNYKIVDTINTAMVDYVSGGTYDAASHTVSFTVPSLTEGQSQSFNFTVKTKTGTYTAPATLISEDVATSSMPVTFVASATGSGAWSVSNVRANSGSYSYKASDPNSAAVETLTSASAYTIQGISTLSFYHYYSTEETYDGGVVQLSSDGGSTWIDAGPYMFENGYNSIAAEYSYPSFSGYSGQFILTRINLSSFAGKQLQFRFVFTADPGQGGEGWYIDDIMLENKAGVYNVASLYNSSNALVNSSDTSTLLTDLLPLKWGHFTAVKEGKVALLNWTTIQEQNTKEFIVEKSTTGVSYVAIGSVRAAGNSNTETSYNLIDGVPAKGVNYYRIRQVDNDGHYTYSEIRSLTFDNSNSEIAITPNPAKDNIVITVPGNHKALLVIVHSTKGEKVGTFTITDEYNKINLPSYPSGAYYVTISGEGVKAITRKLIIK